MWLIDVPTTSPFIGREAGSRWGVFRVNVASVIVVALAVGCSGESKQNPSSDREDATDTSEHDAGAEIDDTDAAIGSDREDSTNTGEDDSTSNPSSDDEADDSTGRDSSGEAPQSEYAGADPNQLPQEQLFECTEGRASSPSRLRRIGRAEWLRNQGGAEGGSGWQNPFDHRQDDQYRSYSSDETIDTSVLDLSLDLIDLPGGGWEATWPSDRGRRRELLRQDDALGPMLGSAQPTDEELRYFLRSFLEHGALFRPPTDYELDHLQEFASRVLEEESSVDERPESISRIAAAAWMTTGTLFRRELGDGSPDDDGRVKLSPWEQAQQLSYAIGGRAPGAAAHHADGESSAGTYGHYADIADAARDGSVDGPDVVRGFIDAHVSGSDPGNADDVDSAADDYAPGRRDLIGVSDDRRRSRRGEYWVGAGIQEFFRDWLQYGDLSAVFKDTPEATSRYEGAGLSIGPAFGNTLHGYYGHEPRLNEQLDDMIARIVDSDRQVLRQLLTSREYYVASSLPASLTRPADPEAYDDYFSEQGYTSWKSLIEVNRVYGLDEDVAPNRSARWVSLPEDERAGVLTHPAWLIAHGGNFEDDASLVERGKWVRENLLCQSVPPLSLVTVAAQLAESDPDISARERVAAATNNAECLGCHALMNPLGEAFEIYNHAGFLRESDHGSPPDGSAELTNLPGGLNGSYVDAIEMLEAFADSAHVEQCFVRQVFRHFMGRAETRADACALSSMASAYADSDGSFKAMLEVLLTSDTFLYRHHEGTP